MRCENCKKIVNNLINEDKDEDKGQLIILKTRWVLFGENQFMSKHT